MLRVITGRLLVAVPTMLLVSVFAFILVQLVPGNVADFILGNTATAARVHALDVQLGLNRPVVDQYFSWLGGVIRGNFGISYTTYASVTSTLAVTLPPTLSLAILATIVTLIAGLALGMLAAVRGGWLDSVIQGIASFWLAIPSFWLAALLVLGFALKIRVFPATGYTSFSQSPAEWLVGLVLPVFAISVQFMAQIVLQARTSTLDILSRDFVRTLQAAGVPRRRILFKHVLRNASIPVATLGGLNFVFLLAGIVVIEYIFNIPGMGTLLVDSVNEHNLLVLQGAVLYFSLVVVVVNLAVDLLVAWLDPRVRVR